MISNICENCNKDFKNKGNYEKHINKKIKCTTTTKSSIKFIDLFCGIGSFHQSFKKLGWECVMACDINEAVRETYKENHLIEPLEDIIKIDPKNIPNYDILCAGIPCQPFSLCGKHLGFDDERGTLFFQVMKFVKFHKPKIVIIENVKGLLTHNNGETLNKMKNELSKEDYIINYKILICSDYGLPQMRQRLFIIGIKKNKTNINKQKRDLINILNLDEYKKEMTLKKFFKKNFEKDIAYTIRCGGRLSPINDKHNWDGYWVNKKEYRLTIPDCLRLQGFDKNFKLLGNETNKWKMIGNTIPTIFTELIGKNLKKYIFNGEDNINDNIIIEDKDIVI